MLPYCWQSVRYQKVAISCKICHNHVQSKHILVSEYILKAACLGESCSKSQISSMQENEIIKNPLSNTSVAYLHVILFRMHERGAATEKELLYYS